MNIYVGNIPVDSTAEDLREWFSDFGTVTHARVAADRQTGRPRGFGFVEMADGAENAIGALNGFRLEGRRLAVNLEAPPPRGRGGGAIPARRGRGEAGRDEKAALASWRVAPAGSEAAARLSGLG